MKDDRTRGDQTTPGDMPKEEFESAMKEVGQWIARYLEEVGKYPVLPSVAPGEVRTGLAGALPEEGVAFSEIFRDFEEHVVPGITHWNHPAFFAYFSITGSGPGILGEALAAALNVNAMVWRSSPAATELEEHTVAWLRDLVGLPEAFQGTINDTASSSSLYAMAAARERLLPEAHDEGLSVCGPARFYASDQAHSSIQKAAMTLGFGREGVRLIRSDDAFRMDAEALRATVEEDLREGVRPVGVIATLGTTSTTSADPVDRIADVAKKFGLWLHVDAAYAGPAAALPELRPLFHGWERADSIVLNPHKWLFTPIDCSVLYVRDEAALRRAFSLTPRYLETAEQATARNLMDYGVSLGRRFRSLKLWFVLRYFGKEGIRRRLRGHIEMARHFAAWIDGDPDWERVAPVPFSTVVFRYRGREKDPHRQDAVNQALMDRVNRSGEVFLSHTVLRDRFCLRLAVGNLRTRWEHLERAWALLREAARAEV